MFVPPTKFMLKLNYQCDSVKRWGFRKVIRFGGQSSHEWEKCTYRRGIKRDSHPFYHVQIQWEGIISEPGKSQDWEFAGTLILTSQPFKEIWEINFCCFWSHPVYGILLWQPERNKTLLEIWNLNFVSFSRHKTLGFFSLFQPTTKKKVKTFLVLHAIQNRWQARYGLWATILCPLIYHPNIRKWKWNNLPILISRLGYVQI